MRGLIGNGGQFRSRCAFEVGWKMRSDEKICGVDRQVGQVGLFRCRELWFSSDVVSRGSGRLN